MSPRPLALAFALLFAVFALGCGPDLPDEVDGVPAPVDGGGEDAGEVGAGLDAGLPDAGGGSPDSGVADDAGTSPVDDAGAPDGGDATHTDAGADAGAAPEVDAGIPDGGSPDAGHVDAGSYRNLVLEESGDPFCGRFDGGYYLYLPDQIAGGGRVLGFFSKNLVEWSSLGSVFDNVSESYGGQNTTALWAPEVLSHEGKYYLYYVNVMSNALDSAVGDKDVVVIESTDPGNFRNGTGRTVLLDGDHAFIDPSPYRDPASGGLFLLFKNRGAAGTGNRIQIRPMSSPTQFSGEAITLLESSDVPEAGQLEHPMLWKSGGKYFLLFSKGLGSDESYQIVYATSTSPTGPFTYRGALFESDSPLTGDLGQKVIAPGASSIVRDGAGELWMVYRQKTTTADTFADRAVAIDPVDFDPPNSRILGAATKGLWRPAPVPLP